MITTHMCGKHLKQEKCKAGCPLARKCTGVVGLPSVLGVLGVLEVLVLLGTGKGYRFYTMSFISRGSY